MLIKTAHLTIDDSPSVHMDERIRFLNSNHIPAVWFCRGDYLEMRPESAILALQSGLVLGNHSYDHAYFSKITLKEAFDQIDLVEAILEDLHIKAGVERKVKCFRFPYEAKIGTPDHHAALQAGLRERGFVPLRATGVVNPAFLDQSASGDVSWFWTYDSEDWKLVGLESPEASGLMASVLERMDRDDIAASCGLNRAGTEIVLMHDHNHTGSQWQTVIEGLLAKGLRFSLSV